MKFLVAAILLLLCITCVYADIPANQTPETQGLDTDTMVRAVGLVTESDSVVWQGSSYMLDDPPLSSPLTATPLVAVGSALVASFKDPSGTTSLYFPTGYPNIALGDVFFWNTYPPWNIAGEVQYVTSYNEDTIADSGVTSYTKSMNIDTRNKVANQQNFEAEKQVDFIGSDTGAITSDESLLLDTAGQYGWGQNLFICPFAANNNDIIPQFCNIEEMGSRLTMTQMSLTTSASDRFIAASADTPVAMDYNIIVNGIGDAPALGDVTAYMNSHSMEGRMIPMYINTYTYYGTLYRPGLGADVVYNEETTGQGTIYYFQKDMSYISGIRR